MIDLQHLQEWRNSCVDDAIVELNVESLHGSETYESLLYSSKIERTNTGRIPAWMLRRYAHIERGGWWASGLNPKNWQPDQWGTFKPNFPQRDDDGKILKYESPPKVPTSVFFLRVPLHIWQAIAKRFGVAMPADITITEDGEAIGFWVWVISNKVPFFVTEGVKKAGALLSAGYPAIGLPGIQGGYRRLQDGDWNPAGTRKLIPELEILKDHPVYFVFDHDTKAKTVRAVNDAIQKTGELLRKQGCEVRVVTWTEPEKGVDDFILANGVEAFEECYKSAQPLDKWRSRLYGELTYHANITLNQRYLGELDIPSSAKLVGIKSAKNTGKTESLARIAEQAAHEGKWVLILTHRIQLGMELSRRLGLPYISEVRSCETGKLLGFGLCIDSLHQKSQAQFSATNWHDGIVVLDECEQVAWHLLNSSTCQGDRVSILGEFKTLISNALTGDGQVILSDADLSDVTLDYVRDLAGVNEAPWIILNQWKPTGWKIHNYQDTTPAGMIAALEEYMEGEYMEGGGKPFICCSGQKAKSRFGTRNLEAYLSQKFPHLKGLRIDSESIADPTHPAFGCTTHLNEILGQYDYVLASPSLETGVSIDIKGHFTSVWGILQGVSPENSARQALSRVREPVDRHIWVAPHGLGKIGNGSTSIKSLLASQHKLLKGHIQALKTADFDCDDLDTAFDAVSLRTWAKMAVRVNAGMVDYRGSVLAGLRAEGHQIINVGGGDGDRTTEELTQVRDTEHQKEADAIANAPTISQAEFEKLKEKRSKTSDERHQERKHSLKLRYAVDATPDLVIKDDDGWYPQLQLHYYLTLGKEHLPTRDKKRLTTAKEQGEGAAWLPDLNKSLLSAPIGGLERLGILRLLDTERQFKNSDDDLQEIAQNAIAVRWQIKAALGISINEKDTPVQVMQKLLDKLGLRLSFLRKEGARGEQQRVYGVAKPEDGRDKVFTAWLARDEAARLAELQNVSSSDTVVTAGNKEYIDNPPDYQTPQTTNEAAAELRNVSSSDTVVTAGNKEYLPVSPDYQNQIPQSIDEAGAAGEGWVGKALRVMQGMYEGRVVRIVKQLDDCFEVCEGWLVSRREVERGFYAIA